VLETIASICFSRLAQVRVIAVFSRPRSHLHLLKLLRDCGQPFVELRTHEILKDSRFLVVLAGGKTELEIAAIEDELEGATLAESVFGSSLAAA